MIAPRTWFRGELDLPLDDAGRRPVSKVIDPSYLGGIASVHRPAMTALRFATASSSSITGSSAHESVLHPGFAGGHVSEPDWLKVLVLSRSYPSSVLPGLGLWVEKPTLELNELCDVQVVSPVPWCPPLPNVGPLRQYVRFRSTARHEIRSGIDVYRPRLLVGPGQALYSLEAKAYHAAVAPTVKRLRKRFPFDLVHAHFIYPDGVVAQRLGDRYGVPFVVSEHAPWVPWLERSSVREPALAAARKAAFLLPVSTWVRSTILDYVDAERRIRVVPNGVDGSVFTPSSNGAGRRPGQILFVGLIKYVKGIDVLLEAMRLVRAHREGARVVLVGGSFYRHTRLQWLELERMAEQLGVADCVTFVGAKPVEEVARLMRESAVLVLPSRAESFGAVLVEALASGTPVVATTSGGPEDIVADDLGILVPKEDPAALAEAIISVLDHPDRYPPEKLRAHALERYEWRTVAERIHAAYEEAVRR